MIIPVFVPKNETRIPKEGEWARLENGNFVKCSGGWSGSYPIFTLREIEVPDEIPWVSLRLDNTGSWWSSKPIPLLRPKVKKWMIEGTTARGQVVHAGPATEKEIRWFMDDFPYTKWKRIKEIEVEE